MQKVDPTVRKETEYMALVVVILSVLMQAVFLIAGHWSTSVLWGTVLGAATAILNFFLMGLTVQNATKREEKDARNVMKLSQSLRFFGLFAVIGIIYFLPGVSAVAALIPLFFPRIAAGIRPLFMKKGGAEYDAGR